MWVTFFNIIQILVIIDLGVHLGLIKMLSFMQLVATITHQSHLCPLPLSVQPIIWNYDHCLHLYPTPHTVKFWNSFCYLHDHLYILLLQWVSKKLKHPRKVCTINVFEIRNIFCKIVSFIIIINKENTRDIYRFIQLNPTGPCIWADTYTYIHSNTPPQAGA